MRKSGLYGYYLLVFFSLNATTKVLPQSTDTAGERKPLLEVLIDLNKSKGVYFLFSQQPLGKVLVEPPVLSTNMPVEKILSQILKNTGLYFKKVDDRTFVI